jgi:HAUS augmin-like complex subunit 1
VAHLTMAHHRLLSEDSAIFSPSVARIAASTARDWSYIDAWLSSKFHPRPVPSFERNNDTLKALLALASANEAADEERNLVAKAEAAALQELTDSEANAENNSRPLREGLMEAVQHNLPADGHTALDAMASVALQFGIAFPEPEALGQGMIQLQSSIHDAEQMKDRVKVLHKHIDDEAARINDILENLKSEEYQPPAHLAKQNLDMQRKIKALSTKLPELQDKVASLVASSHFSHPTVADLARDEQEYLSVVARKKELDLQLASFQGLPSNPDMARAELDELRQELRSIESQRDTVFEGLVERESPVKRRR